MRFTLESGKTKGHAEITAKWQEKKHQSNLIVTCCRFMIMTIVLVIGHQHQGHTRWWILWDCATEKLMAPSHFKRVQYNCMSKRRLNSHCRQLLFTFPLRITRNSVPSSFRHELFLHDYVNIFLSYLTLSWRVVKNLSIHGSDWGSIW